MSQTAVKKRYEWIDIARGIGIVLVMFGHINYPYITDEIYTFHIPLLFFLSGVVFNDNKPVKIFFMDELKRLVIPYYCWALLFFVLPGAIIDFIGGNGFFIPVEYKQYLYMGRLDCIWYLSALLVIHIISYTVLKLSKGNGFVLGIVSVLLFAGFYIYYQNGGKNLWFNIDIACMGILFFAAGYLLNKKSDVFEKLQNFSDRKKMICLIAFAAVNIAAGTLNRYLSGENVNMFQNCYANPLLMLISAFFGIAAVMMLSVIIKSRVFKYIGQNSMPYFIMHQRLYIYIYAYLYSLIGFDRDAGILNQTINFILLPVVMCGVLTAVNMIIVRIKPLSFILGTGKKG